MISSFGDRLLKILASKQEPVSLKELAASFPDGDRVSTEVVEAYLNYGLADQVREVQSGHWVHTDHHKPLTQDSENQGRQNRNARYTSFNAADAIASADLQQAILLQLALAGGAVATPALCRRLATQNYEVRTSQVEKILKGELSSLVRQVAPSEWAIDPTARVGASIFLGVREQEFRLAEALQTAHDVYLLLASADAGLSSEEIANTLSVWGHPIDKESIEHTLEGMLSRVAEKEEYGNKWQLNNGPRLNVYDLALERGSEEGDGRDGAAPQNFIDELEHWLDGSEQAVVPSSWITERWGAAGENGLSEQEARALSGFLEGYGLGIEPDIRFGGNPSHCEHVVIFRTDEEEDTGSDRFGAARLLLELGAAVASVDEEISDDEERRIRDHLEEALYLSPSQRARLRAHLERRLNHPPDLEEIRRRAAGLPMDDRHRLARFLVTVAGADGVLKREEIILLRKIYQALDVETEKLQADIQEMSSTGEDNREEGPVTVVEADGQSESYRVPENDETEEVGHTTSIHLSMEKLEHVQAETRDAAEVLSKVFEDPEREQAGDSLSATGLRTTHVSLIMTLQHRSTWPRDEFETVAEEHGLMPGYAIEQLNQVAFSEVDEPLLEGDDPIELNAFALEALKS